MKKKIVLKALTDPTFRKMLNENPEAALTPEEIASIKGGVDGLLDLVDLVNEEVTRSSTRGQMLTWHRTRRPPPSKERQGRSPRPKTPTQVD